jgi:CDP-glycerol glycerophosphotransferase (TagB/SpsB family)
MLKGIGRSENILFQGQLVEVLLIADLVVSQYSTAIGEAAIVGKPVIMVDLFNFRGGEDYIRAGICLYVTNSADLLRAIEKALNDQSIRNEMTGSREAFIARYFYKLDGHAAERVVEALNGVTKRV